MSHYAVAVFSKEPTEIAFDELLAPYCETNEKYFTAKDEKGNAYNPNAKWEWYTLDGKDYLFNPKKNEKYDDGVCFYRKNQIRFETNPKPKDYKASLQFWKEHVEPQDGDGCDFWTKEYYLKRFKNAEDFAYKNSVEIPYAFLTPDGVWHAPGTVGWFATDDATADSEEAYCKEWFDYIARSGDDPYVSFVDCHI